MGEKQSILVVDDDLDNLKLVSRTLEHMGYEVSTASSGEEGLKRLGEKTPDLILLDINMPGMSGIETLRLVRKNDKHVSIIFLTAKSETEDVIVGLDAGADDYIRKPFDPRELLARIKAQLRIKDLHDQLQEANAKLKQLVDIDDLTGLYNMRSIYKKLDFELDRARRYDGSIAAVMMDMDNFKAVNDGHDHLFGSFVLSEVGKIIRENIRTVDFAARYGGDEFLVVLTHSQGEGAKSFAERLRSKIAQYLFKQGKDEINLTSSIGLAYCEDGDVGIDARELVRQADNALYQAKREGKNRVVAVKAEAGQIIDPKLARKHV